MMPSLPRFSLVLPEWTETSFETYKTSTQKLKKISRSAGTGSARFEKSCRRILLAIKSKNKTKLINNITKAIDVRAYTYILSHSKFNLNPLFSEELFERIHQLKYPMSRLSLLQLIRCYVTHFDKLGKSQQLARLVSFISNQLDSRVNNENDIFGKISKNQEIILNENAPKLIVKRAIDQDKDMDNVFSDLALDNFIGSRLVEMAQFHYYVEQLRNIPLGVDDPLLAEICKKNVILAPFGDDLLLGHKILEILIDRSIGKTLSNTWQKVILSIAGDPRVPKSSKNFITWWEVLGEKRIAAMRGWLSRFDLKLFLTALEQSAKDLSNADMERMYTSRKVFMESLLKQGLISESRLFLSSQAIKYLHRHYSKTELPDFARVESSDTSMIYLNLHGKAHIIEGSHSFAIKIFDRLPDGSKVDNYSVKRIHHSELRRDLIDKYKSKNKRRANFIELRHDPSNAWQYKTMKFLKSRGIDIDPFDIIERDKVLDYRSKYGAI